MNNPLHMKVKQWISRERNNLIAFADILKKGGVVAIRGTVYICHRNMTISEKHLRDMAF